MKIIKINNISNFLFFFLFLFSMPIFSMKKNVRDIKDELYLALLDGDLKVVKDLIENGGIDVNSKIPTCSMPIHCAASEGHLEIVRYLFEKGANVHLKVVGGQEPIDFAVQEGHLEIVKYLLAKGDYVNLKDSRIIRLVNDAIQDGHLNIAKYLVEYLAEEKGGDINSTDGIFRKRPIDVAVECGQLEMVKYFVEVKRVDVNSVNRNLRRPIDVAVECDQLEMVKYLRFVSDFENAEDKCKFILDLISESIEEKKEEDFKLFVSFALNRKNYILNDFRSFEDSEISEDSEIFEDSKTSKDNETLSEKFFRFLRYIFSCKSRPATENIALKEKTNEKPKKRYKNIEAYCKICSKLFSWGKKNKIVKKAILDALKIEERDYESDFYFNLMSSIVEDQVFNYEVVTKGLTKLGKRQMHEELANNRLGKGPKIAAPDVKINFKLS